MSSHFVLLLWVLGWLSCVHTVQPPPASGNKDTTEEDVLGTHLVVLEGARLLRMSRRQDQLDALAAQHTRWGHLQSEVQSLILRRPENGLTTLHNEYHQVYKKWLILRALCSDAKEASSEPLVPLLMTVELQQAITEYTREREQDARKRAMGPDSDRTAVDWCTQYEEQAREVTERLSILTSRTEQVMERLRGAADGTVRKDSDASNPRDVEDSTLRQLLIAEARYASAHRTLQALALLETPRAQYEYLTNALGRSFDRGHQDPSDVEEVQVLHIPSAYNTVEFLIHQWLMRSGGGEQRATKEPSYGTIPAVADVLRIRRLEWQYERSRLIAALGTFTVDLTSLEQHIRNKVDIEPGESRGPATPPDREDRSAGEVRPSDCWHDFLASEETEFVTTWLQSSDGGTTTPEPANDSMSSSSSGAAASSTSNMADKKDMDPPPILGAAQSGRLPASQSLTELIRREHHCPCCHWYERDIEHADAARGSSSLFRDGNGRYADTVDRTHMEWVLLLQDIRRVRTSKTRGETLSASALRHRGVLDFVSYHTVRTATLRSLLSDALSMIGIIASELRVLNQETELALLRLQLYRVAHSERNHALLHKIFESRRSGKHGQKRTPSNPTLSQWKHNGALLAHVPHVLVALYDRAEELAHERMVHIRKLLRPILIQPWAQPVTWGGNASSSVRQRDGVSSTSSSIDVLAATVIREHCDQRSAVEHCLQNVVRVSGTVSGVGPSRRSGGAEEDVRMGSAVVHCSKDVEHMLKLDRLIVEATEGHWSAVRDTNLEQTEKESYTAHVSAFLQFLETNQTLRDVYRLIGVYQHNASRDDPDPATTDRNRKGGKARDSSVTREPGRERSGRSECTGASCGTCFIWGKDGLLQRHRQRMKMIREEVRPALGLSVEPPGLSETEEMFQTWERLDSEVVLGHECSEERTQDPPSSGAATGTHGSVPPAVSHTLDVSYLRATTYLERYLQSEKDMVGLASAPTVYQIVRQLGMRLWVLHRSLFNVENVGHSLLFDLGLNRAHESELCSTFNYLNQRFVKLSKAFEAARFHNLIQRTACLLHADGTPAQEDSDAVVMQEVMELLRGQMHNGRNPPLKSSEAFDEISELIQNISKPTEELYKNHSPFEKRCSDAADILTLQVNEIRSATLWLRHVTHFLGRPYTEVAALEKRESIRTWKGLLHDRLASYAKLRGGPFPASPFEGQNRDGSDSPPLPGSGTVLSTFRLLTYATCAEETLWREIPICPASLESSWRRYVAVQRELSYARFGLDLAQMNEDELRDLKRTIERRQQHLGSHGMPIARTWSREEDGMQHVAKIATALHKAQVLLWEALTTDKYSSVESLGLFLKELNKITHKNLIATTYKSALQQLEDARSALKNDLIRSVLALTLGGGEVPLGVGEEHAEQGWTRADAMGLSRSLFLIDWTQRQLQQQALHDEQKPPVRDPPGAAAVNDEDSDVDEDIERRMFVFETIEQVLLWESLEIQAELGGGLGLGGVSDSSLSEWTCAHAGTLPWSTGHPDSDPAYSIGCARETDRIQTAVALYTRDGMRSAWLSTTIEVGMTHTCSDIRGVLSWAHNFEREANRSNSHKEMIALGVMDEDAIPSSLRTTYPTFMCVLHVLQQRKEQEETDFAGSGSMDAVEGLSLRTLYFYGAASAVHYNTGLQSFPSKLQRMHDYSHDLRLMHEIRRHSLRLIWNRTNMGIGTVNALPHHHISDAAALFGYPDVFDAIQTLYDARAQLWYQTMQWAPPPEHSREFAHQLTVAEREASKLQDETKKQQELARKQQEEETRKQQEVAKKQQEPINTGDKQLDKEDSEKRDENVGDVSQRELMLRARYVGFGLLAFLGVSMLVGLMYVVRKYVMKRKRVPITDMVDLDAPLFDDYGLSVAMRPSSISMC